MEPSLQALSQSGTFSIDYFVPARSHYEDGFEALRDLHNSVFEQVFNTEEPIDKVQLGSQSDSPSSSSSQSRSISDIWQKKAQFNIASAESLLNAFKSMLEFLPFMVLPTDSTIPNVAASMPFVLLAILTVASGSRTVQKHSLYDDEFLRVLGLKYVSGAERSLQLLQGLLIYCAWYPFHLSPRNSQLAHCLRMASDVVHDLCLDENFLASDTWEVTDEELDKIRAYLAYVYLVSTYIVVWKGDRCLRTSFPPWTDAATAILEQNAKVEGDHVLAALVRLSRLCSDASDAINDKENQTIRSIQMVLVGIEQQYQLVRNNLLATSPAVLEKESVRLQSMFVDIYIDTGSLLSFPVAKTSLTIKTPRIPPPTSKIYSATKKLRTFLDYVGEMDDLSLLSFTVNDWTRLIVILTLSFRLSFPLSLCPEFDWKWANSEIQLDHFLSKVSRDADSTIAPNSILAANRAVLGVLKTKYNRRLSALAEASTSQWSRTAGCPVMGGGGLSQNVAQWNSGLTEPSEPSTDSDMPEILPIFHDLWAAEAGWQDSGEISWESFFTTT